MISILVLHAAVSLTTVLSLHLFPGGRCHGKAMVREREDVRKKIIWRHSAALAPSSFVPPARCNNGECDRQAFSTEENRGERSRAAGRGGHLTDKKKKGGSSAVASPLCWTQFCVTGLCKHRERGRREERREEGRKERRGRGGNSAQCKLTGWVAAAAQAAASAPLAL